MVTCYFGFRGVQTRLIWSAQNCGASRAIILRRVILPAALPSIFSGLRVALPVAIIVVVITEMIGDSIGLGYYITIWSTRFTFANVYAAIIVIGICGLVLDQAPAAAAPPRRLLAAGGRLMPVLKHIVQLAARMRRSMELTHERACRPICASPSTSSRVPAASSRWKATAT